MSPHIAGRLERPGSSAGRLLFVALLTVATAPALASAAGDVSFRRLAIPDSLAHNRVRELHVDSAGALWDPCARRRRR